LSNDYKRGSFQLMKSINRSIVLNMIREKAPISRAEIAKQTKLTPPTVGNIVKELIDDQFVLETTQGESHGGRKPTYLEIRSDQFFIIGIDVGKFEMKFVVTNLHGFPVDKVSLEMPNANELLTTMKTGINHLLIKSEHLNKKFLGIGVGMHGIVNTETGVSLYAPFFDTYNIPIKSELESEYEMLVKVENDAKTMTLGESWIGNGNQASTLVGINVGNGIGAGITINGELYQGEHFIAGEIGHMTIDLSGPLCSCGNYGCLQALAAGPAIAENAIKSLKTGRSSKIIELVDGELERINGVIIHEAAKQGDSFSIELLNQTGRYLGIGITNLIHMVNPERIILGGGVAQAGDFILEPIKKAIKSRGLTEEAKNTPIVFSKLGKDASAIGASVLILKHFYQAAD
jgi:N-acetylglucosamine repressor